MPTTTATLGLITAAVATLGVGATAAETALPGDPLYPVKTSINENVRASLSFDAESDAEWELRLAERRFEEAQALAAEGRLSAELKSELQEDFSTHWDNAIRLASDLETRGETDAAGRIRANLDAFAQSNAGLTGDLDDEEGTRGNARAMERADAHAGLSADALFHGLFQGHFKDNNGQGNAYGRSSTDALIDADGDGRLDSDSSVSADSSARLDTDDQDAGVDADADSDTDLDLNVDDDINGSAGQNTNGSLNLGL